MTRKFGPAVAILLPSGDQATEFGFVACAIPAKAIRPVARSHTRRYRSAETAATCEPAGRNATSGTMSVADVFVSASFPAGTVVVPLVSLSKSSRRTYVSFDSRRNAENPKDHRFSSRVTARAARSYASLPPPGAPAELPRGSVPTRSDSPKSFVPSALIVCVTSKGPAPDRDVFAYQDRKS